MEVYRLIADRTGQVLAEGTYEQCLFALNAMHRYGIAEDRVFMAPADYLDQAAAEAKAQ